jgi:hypothetical protein
MSTAFLFVLGAVLVFSPFLLEIARGIAKLARRLASRRPAPPPPEYGATFESSVRGALYGSEPRWQRLEVESARPGAGRPEPPYVVGRPETGAPLHRVALPEPEPEREPQPAEASEYAGGVRAA